MEVHHHSHHPKKWKEYITEFIMLFAAVTLGFLAENLREHQIIEKQKVQNLTTMIEDLKQDSIEIEKRISEYSNTLVQFELLKDLSVAYSPNKILEREYIDSAVDIYLNAKYGIALFINNASYKNIISSGNLSHIKSKRTKMLIAQYYESLYGKIIVNNKNLDDDVSEFMNKSFVFGYMGKKEERKDFQSRSNNTQLEDFKTIPAFKKLITAPEFRLYVNKIEGRCGYYLFIMKTAQELNKNLLIQLKKQEL